MQISTSVLPTRTAVTLMRFVVILLDRTHAHVRQDSQAMEKHALVSCCGVAKKRFPNDVRACIFCIRPLHLNM